MHQRTILIVEDDAILALHLQSTLGELGYNVLQPVATGQRAVESVARHRPDLVLMDIELSGEINGIQATEAIRQTSNVPIVYLTGFSQNQLLQQAKATGPYGYLVKPVPERELSATIEIALYRHALDGKLRESEDRFRRLAENATDLIYRYELIPERRFSYVSPAAVSITGYTPEEHYADPDLGFKLVHPEDRSLLEDTARGGNVPGQSVVLRWIHKDGSIIWTEQRNTPIFDSAGNIVALEGIARDITDRKRAEEEIRLLAELTNISPATITVHDFEGNFLYANQRTFDLLGYTREEFLSLNLREIIVSPRAEVASARLEEIRQTGQASFEVEHHRKDMSILPLEVFVKKLRWRGKEVLLSVGVDISERKRASAALRESEQMFSVSFRNGPAMMSISDIDTGEYIEVNDRFVELLGFSRDEVIGKTSLDLGVLHAIDRQVMIAELRKKGRISVLEMKIRKKNGESLWCSFSAEIVTIGGVKKLLSIAEDITERKRAEDALRQAQKLESIGTLAGGIAHDFNNLLNAILGQSSLAMGKTDPESPARSHMAKAVKATERAAELTRQLLAYSGKGRFFLEDLDVNRLVRENVQMLELSIPKTIVLHYELAPMPVTVRGDKAQIQQVIMNLLINAGEAIGSAPGTILMRTSQVRIVKDSLEYSKYTNSALPPGEYVALQISDTGCGISEESLLRLFDPFYTTKFTGRGLGLAAVLGIVRGHKGGIRIETEVGKGTQFEVVLPALGAPEATLPGDLVDDVTMKGEGRTVLVIDDQPNVLELVTDILTEAEFNVIGSLDRHEGIGQYRRKWKNISLVILDYSMPGMDGKAALMELLGINTEAKVLVVSGYAEDAIAASFDDVQPAGFIQKPYKPATLLDKVLKLLGER